MPTVFETGPFLALATFCDDVIAGADGTISVIRAVDTVTARAQGEAVPSEMPPVAVRTKLVLSFKTGEARARMMLTVRVEDPMGVRKEMTQHPLTFTGPAYAGVNFIVEAQLGLEHEGLYWFDILLDQQLLTRVPLRAVYEPLAAPST